MELTLFVVADGGVESAGKRFHVAPEKYRIESKTETLAGSPDTFLEISARVKEAAADSVMTRELTLRLCEGDIEDIARRKKSATSVLTGMRWV